MVRRPKDSMTHKITITKNSNTSFMQIKRPIFNENRLTIQPTNTKGQPFSSVLSESDDDDIEEEDEDNFFAGAEIK